MEAAEDLLEIVRYTRKEWGSKSMFTVNSSAGDIENIGKGSVIMKSFSENLPAIFVTRAEKHLVFYIAPPNSKLIIIAVLHDSSDFVMHPGNRL